MKNTRNSEHIPKRSTMFSAGYDIPVSELPKVTYFIGNLACLDGYMDIDAKKYVDLTMLYESPSDDSGTMMTLYPGVVYRFYTGLHLEHGDITNYQYLMIVPRSSMRKYGLRMLNTCGIIDSDYRDEIQIDVCVEKPLEVRIGDKLCQFIVCEYGRIAGEIEPTETRSGGFGSTGV